MKRLLPGDPRRPSPITRAVARRIARSSGWLAVVCVLTSVFLYGCPGTLDPGVGPGPGGGMGGSMANCEVPLLAAKCALSGCHAAGSPAAGLDLQSADFKTRLVDHATDDGTAGGMCMGMKVLDANSNPATGVLIDKITLADPCGSPMPLGGSLTTAEKNCLTSWATGLTSTTAFIEEARP